jgi:hypothetical protein
MTAGDDMQPLLAATRGGVHASHGWRTSILGNDRKSIIEIGGQFPIQRVVAAKSNLLWIPKVWHPVSFDFEQWGENIVSFWREEVRQDGAAESCPSATAGAGLLSALQHHAGNTELAVNCAA